MTISHINRLQCAISNTPGTGGNLIVSGAVAAGRRTFTAAQDGLSFEPTFEDGLAWETRTGCVYTHSTTTLTRGTLVDSSTGSAIALTSATVVTLGPTAKQMTDLELARFLPPTSTTAQIQAAIDSVAASGGGVVQLGAGVFTCTNVLLVKSGVQLRGSGRRATILRAPAGAYPGVVVNSGSVFATVAMVDVSDASVSSLTVDNATNGGTGNGIVCLAGGATGAGAGCDRCVIQDCEVLGYNAHQYLIWQRRSRNISIINNFIDGGVTSYDAASTQEGIECYGGDAILVQGNTVKNVGSNGGFICPEPIVGGPCLDIRYVDNYFSNCKVGVYLLPAMDVSNIHISRNHVFNTWRAGIKSAGSGSFVFDGLSIIDNVVKTSPTGIDVSGSGTNVFNRLLIANNSLSTAIGVNLSNTGPGSVAGNTINTSAGAGVQLDSCTRMAITDNEINAVGGHGIYSYSTTGGFFCNNRIKYDGGGANYGVFVNTATNLVIDANYFKWVTLGWVVYAIGTGSVTVGLNNKTSGSYGGNPVYKNDATNPNFGTFTLTAASTTKIITNSLVQNSSMVHVQQTGGTQRPFTLTQGTGDFTMTFSAAVGDETFKYVIW